MARYGSQYGPDITFLGVPRCTWDEQATFTPDMSRVIFMSTRDHPGFFNSYRDLADRLGIPADTDWATILPVFGFSEGTFSIESVKRAESASTSIV